jgi:hypothetical protein
MPVAAGYRNDGEYVRLVSDRFRPCGGREFTLSISP